MSKIHFKFDILINHARFIKTNSNIINPGYIYVWMSFVDTTYRFKGGLHKHVIWYVKIHILKNKIQNNWK
jgi:hypothetical protein